MSNRTYGKLTDGVLKYAPNAITTEDAVTLNPTNEQYLAAGYKRIDDTPPETDNSHYAEPNGWEETDGELVRVYVVREIVKAPRVFSKLKCYAALQSAGYWDAVQSWLEQSGLWTAFLLAQNVSEDHPQFVEGLAALKAALGLNDEQVETILANCVEV